MDLYVVRRNGWESADDLNAAAERSTAVGAEMADDIRWIRSYVTKEAPGLATVCIYEATSEAKIREHAERAQLPCDEVIEVANTVVVRPDPA